MDVFRWKRLGMVAVSTTKEEFLGAPAISSQEWFDIGVRWSRWLEDNRNYFEKTY
jgi:hypothetical protein